MIDFYNAFISYRHAKLDMSIASHIQRKLEHFHVPHKLKKKLKHQKINRIFRDKDELPITSDLTETITDALAKSEYLIVICSTNTKDSMWVKREIQTFLQTHTKDKILTVLCNGEPQDVIPEELLTGEKIITDANGFQHTIKVPVEPLSCDYRLSRSRADNEELPRLASALLGCSYDELQRRNRQYRIRRVAAIVAAAFLAMAGFMTYSLIMSKKINDNYIATLKQRSVYLATASEELLEQDLRVDAVHLALAALPTEDGDKTPVTAQAVRALADATAAYQSNSGNDFEPVWNYRTEHAVSLTLLSEDQKYIATLDECGSVNCWNTLTHELVFEKQGAAGTQNMMFLGNDTILVIYSYYIEAYNIQTGTMIWDYKPEDDVYLSPGSIAYANNSVYLDIGYGEVGKLSIRDGSIKESYKLRDDAFVNRIYNLAVSSDGKKIAYSDADFIFMGEQIHVYDTETKKNYASFIDTYIIQQISFIDNDHICVLSDDDLGMTSLELADEMTAIRTDSKEIHCFDTTMNEIWTHTLDFTDVAFTLGTLYIPSRDAVVYYVGNRAEIYDVKTGDTLNSYHLSSSIITANDFNLNGLPEFVCRHGEYIFASSENNDYMTCYYSLVDDIKSAVIGDLIYATAKDGNNMICYNRFLQDDEWEFVSSGDFSTGSDYQVCYSDDDYLIIGAKVYDADFIRVTVIDMNDASVVFTEDVEGFSLSRAFEICYIDDEYFGCFGENIYRIDIDKKSVELINGDLDYSSYVTNGKIVSFLNFFHGLDIAITDLDGSNQIELSYEDEDSSFTQSTHCVYLESLDTVFISIGSNLFAADLSKEELVLLDTPENWMIDYTFSFYVSESEDNSKILFADGNLVWVADTSFNILYSFNCNCAYRCATVFNDDVLYIIADDYLKLYNSKTGEYINKYEITLWGKGDAEMTLDEKTHQLFIQVGDQLSIFDTESWVETVFIENCYCYHEATDRFFVYSFIYSTDCIPGYIKHYSLEDLIAKANKFLGDHQLDETTKIKYGLA